MNAKKAIIIGAGPAGLTAAYEFIKRSDIVPAVFESTDMAGGIARTVNYNGNRIDIGGHRFFSKSSRVMEWWLSVFPLQHPDTSISETAKYVIREITRDILKLNTDSGPDPKNTDRIMLVRKRLSRILFRRRFFSYPLSLGIATLRNLGLISLIKITASYILIKLFPIKKENSLEDFFTNRFGRELYKTFFKDYTEKVWGVTCKEIKPDWGAQRIKGLSITKAVWHALSQFFHNKSKINRSKVETSLIDFFMYPKYGPGQLWEEVASRIGSKGHEILFRHTVVGMKIKDSKITEVRIKDETTGEIKMVDADYVISTMPVRDLILGLEGEVPAEVRRVAERLQYRDFLTVGLLFSRLKTDDGKLPDNWIYVQESDVKMGRIQVFNNWSPFLVGNPDHMWLGLEYFCNEGDDLWGMADNDLIQKGIDELVKVGLADPVNFLDGVVLRMPKAYPAYFGSYEQFDIIKDYTDQLSNLFLIGRNGMHKYNNMDHSMLSAMTAVDNILDNVNSKDNIWKVNTETEYHEEKDQE